MDSKDALVVFEGTKIRRIWHDEQWFFSVVDTIHVLIDSGSPRQYWGVLKSREPQLLTICLQLKLPSSDGKYYNTDCVNTENAFRLIQSIPSKKAEPFKRWLAKVGYERVQEIEDPCSARLPRQDLPATGIPGNSLICEKTQTTVEMWQEQHERILRENLGKV